MLPNSIDQLKKSVLKEAVCHVFKKINTGGVVLTAFELLTATYAADDFRLPDDWYGSSEPKVIGAWPAMAVKKVLRGVPNTDFLQAITLIYTPLRQVKIQSAAELLAVAEMARGVLIRGESGNLSEVTAAENRAASACRAIGISIF